MNNKDYCKCKAITMLTTSFDDWYEFDVCCSCNKPIEGSFRPLNHYDGEDHVTYDEY